MRFFLFIPVLLIVCGCSMNFDKAAAEKRLQTINIDKPLPKADNKLTTPIKLAIFMDLETMSSSEEFEETWNWGKPEAKLVLSYAESLKKQGFVSEYFIIPEENLSIQDIGAIMREAEKKGADDLLTIRGIIKVNYYFNPAALLDPTIVGAVLFPGSNRDVMMLVTLDLWDMKTRNSMITINADGIKKICKPTLLIDADRDAVRPLKLETIRKTLIEFRKRCIDLKKNNP